MLLAIHACMAQQTHFLYKRVRELKKESTKIQVIMAV